MKHATISTTKKMFETLNEMGIRCSALPSGDIFTSYYGKNGIYDHHLIVERDITTPSLIVAIPYLFKLQKGTKPQVLGIIARINDSLPAPAFRIDSKEAVLFATKISLGKRGISPKELAQVLATISQTVDMAMGILMPLNWGKRQSRTATTDINRVNRIGFSLN